MSRGLGSAPIAAAAAKTNEPVEQGLISMTGTFIDTLIICTLTGLTILVTGVWEWQFRRGCSDSICFFYSLFFLWADPFNNLPGYFLPLPRFWDGTITESVVLNFSLAFALSGFIVWSLYSWSCWEDLSSWIWFGLSQILSMP